MKLLLLIALCACFFFANGQDDQLVQLLLSSGASVERQFQNEGLQEERGANDQEKLTNDDISLLRKMVVLSSKSARTFENPPNQDLDQEAPMQQEASPLPKKKSTWKRIPKAFKNFVKQIIQ